VIPGAFYIQDKRYATGLGCPEAAVMTMISCFLYRGLFDPYRRIFEPPKRNLFMKLIFKVMPQFVFVMVLAVASAATASTDQNTEAARIVEAMKLYAQATPMDQFDAKRAELLSQSESILLDVIAENPASLDAHRKLMGVYLQMRVYRKAIQTMQIAITLSPEDPKLFIALAILYDHQGAYEYAVPMLDEALALDPNQQLAKDYKASIQQKIDMQNMALETGNPPRETPKPHAK
jgi:tetratricopeptide (TPR) repeat protein